MDKSKYVTHDYFVKDLFNLILETTGCLTCWCPCISFGQIAEIVNKGTTCKCLCFHFDHL